jgi:aryl-alcohol dehydrogenase-like predicted oxidoreductase
VRINMKKIALGTVQFGLEYGIANKSGQLSIDEIKNVLQHAKKNTLNTLDTAIGYGDSEEKLGHVGVSQWNVITKLPTLPESIKDVKVWVRKAVEQSLVRLQTGQLKGLLLHRPDDLLYKHGDALYRALEELKEDGLVQKIGASIYVPEELEPLYSRYNLDIIQAPFNILDRRLKESGWLTRLSDQGTEIHVRSVFLQGLLLMSTKNRPNKFNRWEPLWRKWHAWLSEVGLSPLQACLGYVLSELEIDRVIVGVDSLEQLKEILNVAKNITPDIPEYLHCNDIDLINPARWDAL